MRQRNDSGNALHVSAWPTDDYPNRTPFDVAVGKEIDFPELLAGFTSLEPPEPDASAPEAEAAPAAKPKTRAKGADGAEGGDAR